MYSGLGFFFFFRCLQNIFFNAFVVKRKADEIKHGSLSLQVWTQKQSLCIEFYND